ncbi:MAG: hypothetical protein WCJ64_00875 [Rhodospirillaceae bacterium]
MATGFRRQILDHLATDQDWHSVEEITEQFGLERQDARRTLNDIALDGLISKSDLDYCITAKGLEYLASEAKTSTACRWMARRRVREAALLATLATSESWWSVPAITAALTRPRHDETTLRSLRDFRAKGWLDYRPSPVFSKSPEYRITESGRAAISEGG